MISTVSEHLYKCRFSLVMSKMEKLRYGAYYDGCCGRRGFELQLMPHVYPRVVNGLNPIDPAAGVAIVAFCILQRRVKPFSEFPREISSVAVVGDSRRVQV